MKLESGERRPSQPANTAATMPIQPIHLGIEAEDGDQEEQPGEHDDRRTRDEEVASVLDVRDPIEPVLACRRDQHLNAARSHQQDPPSAVRASTWHGQWSKSILTMTGIRSPATVRR
jgi:hypothetical protein